MEGQNSHTAIGSQNPGQLFHKGIQRFELVIHIDSQCLEGSLTGLLDRLPAFRSRKKSESILYYLTQIPCGINGFTPLQPGNRLPGNLSGIRLIGIFKQHALQFLLRDIPKPLCGADPLFRFIRKSSGPSVL